jgi:hypothetical protein
MSMADLIIKVVKDSNRTTHYGTYPKSQMIDIASGPGNSKTPFKLDHVSNKAHISSDIEATSVSVKEIEQFETQDGIRKTVSTAVRSTGSSDEKEGTGTEGASVFGKC